MSSFPQQDDDPVGYGPNRRIQKRTEHVQGYPDWEAEQIQSSRLAHPCLLDIGCNQNMVSIPLSPRFRVQGKASPCKFSSSSLTSIRYVRIALQCLVTTTAKGKFEPEMYRCGFTAPSDQLPCSLSLAPGLQRPHTLFSPETLYCP